MEYFLTPQSKGNIMIHVLIEKFTYMNVVFAVHLDNEGVYTVSHYLSGRSVTSEIDLYACKEISLKKIEKAMESGYNFGKHFVLNSPKNIQSILEFKAISEGLKKEIKAISENLFEIDEDGHYLIINEELK